ncbi:hypothetical protein [Candidatus Velamenicoccus archaeovorus]|uniref:hypothetical protein n=1 Tax=Velamenicoccus archaeovorus TaxID=1930593 RepID=UPI000FFF19C9|nr:hypothetical protein [Candidatus Velamenicoccus archaeovorus]
MSRLSFRCRWWDEICGNLSFKSLEPVYFILSKSAFPDYRWSGALSIEKYHILVFFIQIPQHFDVLEDALPSFLELSTMNAVVLEGDFLYSAANPTAEIRRRSLT